MVAKVCPVMRTVAVIQARMDSRRLPNKAIAPIGPKSVLGWVIHRTRLVEGVDEVVVATTDRAIDNPIVSRCELMDVPVVCGPTEDVLARYVKAALVTEATHVLRVTADCPLLDPGLNSQIVAALKSNRRAGYVSMFTRSVGLVQEAFTANALFAADVEAMTLEEREHVVPWMLNNVKTLLLRPDHDLGQTRVCVDTAEDLEWLRGLYEVDPGLFDGSVSVAA